MVSKATDYEYVVGATWSGQCDLSDFTPRMKFDGNILPTRNSSVIRGEDIAFLKEFAMQRHASIESVYWMDTSGYKNKSTLIASKRLATLFEQLYGANNLDEKLTYVFPSGSDSFYISGLTNTFSRAITDNLFFDTIPSTPVVASSSDPLSAFASNKLSIPDGFYVNKEFYQSGVGYKHPKLSYDRLKQYFDFCEKIYGGICYCGSIATDSGTAYLNATASFNSPGGSYPALQLITQGESPGTHASVFGYRSYAYEYSSYDGSEHKSYDWKDWVVMPSGLPIYSVFAPHASEMYAMCRLLCTGISSSTSYVYLFLPMEGSNGTFTLTSNAFSTTNAIDSLISASGVNIHLNLKLGNYTYKDQFTIEGPTVYPIITEFDDHTDFLSEGSQS